MSTTGSRAIAPILRILALVAVLTPVMACNLLNPDSDPPDEARVEITGTSVNSLEVVTSTRFSYTSDDAGHPVAVMVESDTVFIDPAAGLHEVYPIAPGRAFLVRLTNPDTTNAVVAMKVWIDGKLEYDRYDQVLWDTSIEFSRVWGNPF